MNNIARAGLDLIREVKIKWKKRLTSLRPFAVHKGKTEFCAHCRNVATQEALFKVYEGITLIERYYDICARKIR